MKKREDSIAQRITSIEHKIKKERAEIMQKFKTNSNTISHAHHFPCLRRETTCYFTLIELLVVIAIITILSSQNF